MRLMNDGERLDALEGAVAELRGDDHCSSNIDHSKGGMLEFSVTADEIGVTMPYAASGGDYVSLAIVDGTLIFTCAREASFAIRRSLVNILAVLRAADEGGF